MAVWRIVAVLIPNAAASRRTLKRAREENRYIDLTFGRSMKCLLLLDDGSVVGCGITHKTILARLDREQPASDEDDPLKGE